MTTAESALLFPNPASNQVNVYSSLAKGNTRVYDVTRRLVSQVVFDSHDFTMELSDFPQECM